MTSDVRRDDGAPFMNKDLLENYNKIRSGKIGYKKLPRGLFSVHGKEAVQFLNGLITNDVKALEEGSMMLAAFPNAQGRLLAVVRVQRTGDEFLIETEEATREKVFNNIFRFTFAGDFFVEDLSEKYSYFSIPNSTFQIPNSEAIYFGNDLFVPIEINVDFGEAVEISDELYEVLRIENGIPLYGVDMDETTIVPEIGLPDVISYKKGCYIGQEIIARIHFRGHIAKQLQGLILDDSHVKPNDEIKSLEGKNAGKITSVCYSPKFEKYIALGYVRYDYLAENTELKIGETTAVVKNIPFI
jgi:folate-binding protein YgfZ